MGYKNIFKSANYIYGRKIKVKFIKMTCSIYRSRVRSFCKTKEGKKILCNLNNFISNKMISNWPEKKGQEVYIYQSNINKSKGMPDIKEFKKLVITTAIL